MSPVAGFATALLLPLIYQGVPNPIAVKWYWDHANAPMPPHMERKAFVVGTFVPVFQVLALGSLVWIIALRTGASLELLGWDLRGWLTTTAIGTIVGSGWLTLYVAILARGVLSRNQLAQHQFMQRSLAYWLPQSLAAAIVEEFWRALCLTSLCGVGSVPAIGITAVAFGLGHAESVGRTLSSTLFAVYVGAIFLWTNSLVATVVAHAVVNLGTLSLVRFAHSRA
jgi:hypothetical protein